MSASFRGHNLAEGGSGATTFPVWARKAKSAILEVPGANEDVIQTFGRKSDTLALPITCTKAELDALYGDVQKTGTLIFHYGSFTAYLDSIDTPSETLAEDHYTLILNFVRQ